MLVQSKHKNWANMDRISNLPDSILTHILSLLPTKLAASTCVLSKRWQFVWVMVLYNVDLVCNPAAHCSQRDFDREASTLRSFANLVNRFFTLRDKNMYMKSFRLHSLSSPNSLNTHDIDSWVLAAMSSAIEELDIHLGLPDPFKLSHRIFTCKTLVVLKLRGNIVIHAPPSSVHFPSLKVLHLDNVAAKYHDSCANLFSGCPVLEKLELSNVRGVEEYNHFVITSPTLRCLTMIFLCSESIQLCLDAPSLEYLNLELDVDTSTDIYFKNLDNLVQANVSLLVLDVEYLSDKVRVLHMVEDALKALHNVQVLTLKHLTSEGLRDVSFEDFPVFHNLVQLEVDGFCGLQRMLLSLLQKLPYLQHLTVDHTGCYEYYGLRIRSDILGPKACPKAWVEFDVANCYTHLRTFCFNKACFDISCGDIEFVTHLLKKSESLENMTITFWWDFSPEKRHAFRRKLESLERASKKCQLKFDGEVL